jgi:hypothetical protein
MMTAGATCPTHPGMPSNGVCTRCGAFMCETCGPTVARRLCAACKARAPDPILFAAPYRNLVLSFGLQLLLWFASTAAPKLAPIIGLGFIATLVMLAVFAFQTTRGMGSKIPALWAVLMLVPCFNSITLLVLSSKATAACREAGIPVGLLGPKLPK